MGCIQCHFSGEKLQNLGMLTIFNFDILCVKDVSIGI